MSKATVVLGAARVVVVFIALVGFLFGQVIFGKFFLPTTLAGVFGITAAIIGDPRFVSHYRKGVWAVLGCIGLAATGLVAEAYVYYTHHNVPGNDFAWELRGPFLFGLLYIAFSALAAKKTYDNKHVV